MYDKLAQTLLNVIIINSRLFCALYFTFTQQAKPLLCISCQT